MESNNENVELIILSSEEVHTLLSQLDINKIEFIDTIQLLSNNEGFKIYPEDWKGEVPPNLYYATKAGLLPYKINIKRLTDSWLLYVTDKKAAK